jgi:hypothetical protein
MLKRGGVSAAVNYFKDFSAVLEKIPNLLGNSGIFFSFL